MKISKIRMSWMRPLTIVLPLLSWFVAPAQGAGFELVTMDEHRQAMDAGENPVHDLVAKSIPGGPSISVVSPIVSKGALSSPVDIEVKFESVGDTSIDMSSLKIYYLMFIKKDVTDRILEHAEIGANSIKAPRAELPSGKHKFLLEISDSKKRRSSQKFVVVVND